MPWTGELYAQSDDLQTYYRYYFIESRPSWNALTSEVVGCGGGSKLVSDDAAHPAQTAQIMKAMHSGVSWCTNLRTKWRRWDDP
ncbi:hypothetical protein UI24_18815 [Mycobacteroides franklinii]|nr:hypothetical protein [Mycobacteroides franklinii]